LLAAFLVIAGPGLAADWTSGPATISLNTTVGLGVFVTPNANFGAGSYDIRTVRDFAGGLRPDAGIPVRSPVWFEGFIKPNLRITYAIDSEHTLFAGVSAAYAKTLGDGDASPFSLTAGSPGSIGLEEAYIGYQAPLPFGLAGDSVVMKFGRQDFTIDDGFLVQLARYDIGKSSGFYLYPHTAFDGWGTIRINTSPVRGDFFVLRADVDNERSYGSATFAIDQPATHFAGFDLEWFDNNADPGANGAVNYLDRARYINFTYFKVYKADRNPVLYGDNGVFWARRDGLNVFSLSGGGNLLPVKDTTLYFQYVRQINTNRDRKVDATGFYIEPGYTFSHVPWSPHVYYRYSYFSGQPGATNDPTATKRSYDILFLGGGIRNFIGNYGLGEIVGNMMAVTSNLIVHNVSLKLTAPFHVFRPTDSLSVELLGYAFLLDHPERAGATSRQYAHEVDIAAQYVLDKKTLMVFAVGVAIPNRGGQESVAKLTAGLPGPRAVGDTSTIAEFFIMHTF
jgi:hypothetical protein